MEPSERCVHRACLVTEKTIDLLVGLLARNLNPGWWSPAWRARTQAECRHFAGMGAGSCSSFTMKPKGWRDGARTWSKKQRTMTCRRKVSAFSITSDIFYELMPCWLSQTLCNLKLTISKLQFIQNFFVSSLRKNQKCCWKCPAFNVTKVSAILLAVPAEYGKLRIWCYAWLLRKILV